MLFDKIHRFFIQKDFQRIPTDSETVRMYGTFHKNSLYLINLIELNPSYSLDIDKYLEYKALTRNQFKKLGDDNVILLNIILIDNPINIYEKINVDPDLNDEFIDINWIIDTKKNELVIPNKQIRNVMHLERDLQTILGNKEYEGLKLVKTDRLPLLTGALILINVFIWLMMELSGGSTNPNVLVKFGAIYTPFIIEYKEYYRLFTANFLHIGATHLFFNCFNLYIFGSRLEKYITRLEFLIIYICAGLFGAAFSLTGNLLMNANGLSAGASGAIYGLIGCIIVCSKLTGKSIDGLSDYMMIIFFILGMALSLVSPNIDSSAHIGGFIGGILFTLAIVKKSKVRSSSAE